MSDRTFTLIHEDGSEQEAEILFTYRSDELNKNYVVYQFGDTVTGSSYTTDGKLEPIETDSEWDLLESLLKSYQDDNK